MTDERKDEGRCTGGCCERFYLPFAPDELWAAFSRWERGGEQVQMSGHPALPVLKEIFLIAPMVVPLGPAKEPAPDGFYVNPTDADLVGGAPEPDGYWYTCKHFDAGSRRCSIYEHRPSMCRDYPYGKPCRYRCCTWGDRREREETPEERQARRDRLLAERAALSSAGGGQS